MITKEQIKQYIKDGVSINELVDKYSDDLKIIAEAYIEYMHEENDEFDKQLKLLKTSEETK